MAEGEIEERMRENSNLDWHNDDLTFCILAVFQLYSSPLEKPDHNMCDHWRRRSA